VAAAAHAVARGYADPPTLGIPCHGGTNNPWHEVADEFTGDPGSFQERHYAEFGNFRPTCNGCFTAKGRK
jgi:hypothetical protein